MEHRWYKTRYHIPVIFISRVTKSVDSNHHEIIENKPRMHSQSILVKSKTKIFLSMHAHIYFTQRLRKSEGKEGI